MADISKIKLPNNTTYDINAATVNGHTVDKNVPSNAVFTDTNTHRPIKVNGSQILGNNTAPFNLVSGDNVRMAITGSGSVTIHSDQINDSYTYSQYQDLSDSIKMQDKIFMVQDAPNPPSIPVVDEYAREQIEDVKSNLIDLEYTLVGAKYGNVAMNLPTNWKELVIYFRYGNSNGLQAQVVQGSLLRIHTQNTNFTYAVGSGTISAQFIVNTNDNTITMTYFAVGTTAYTATSQMTVYARS